MAIYIRLNGEKLFLTLNYYEMQYRGLEYNLFSIMSKKKFEQYLICCNGTQVAQVTSSIKISKKQYDYTIYAINLREAKASVILCVYMHICNEFKLREKITKFYEDSNFIQTIEE